MDSDRLRVGSPHDIREALDQAASSGQSGEQFREWIIKYAWHLPEVVRGQPATTITEKLKTDSWHAAQQIAEFVRQ